MKKNIYVFRDLELKREGNVLKIEDRKIPISMIDNVFIFSRVKITRSAQNLLLKNSGAVFYFNSKYELNGILISTYFSSDLRCRIFQYENFNSLELAKFIILKKIEAIEKKTASLKRYKEKLQKCNSLNEVLGVEGNCSSYMFKKFREILENLGIKEFKKREYRPVKDRINSLLSFLYTLYYSYAFGEVVSRGFDPYIGFLHRKRGRHAVFVSDIMEEARVELTFLAVYILKEIYEDGFDGIFLNKDAREFVVRKFDSFLESYENNILKELKEKVC